MTAINTSVGVERMNRRDFIKTVGVALAAAATRKWPAIAGPLRNRECETGNLFSRTGALTFDAVHEARQEFARRLDTTGRIIYVDGTRGKDDRPEDGLTPRTAYRHTGNTWLIEVVE